MFLYFRRVASLGLFSAVISCLPGRTDASTIEHFTRPETERLQLPFSEAVRVGNTVYLAGQIGMAADGSGLVSGGIGAESEQALKNIQAVLSHFNLTFQNVVRCQVMLVDIKDWPQFNAVYKKFVKAPYPARSAFAGSGIALNARVEVECTAAVPRGAER